MGAVGLDKRAQGFFLGCPCRSVSKGVESGSKIGEVWVPEFRGRETGGALGRLGWRGCTGVISRVGDVTAASLGGGGSGVIRGAGGGVGEGVAALVEVVELRRDGCWEGALIKAGCEGSELQAHGDGVAFNVIIHEIVGPADKARELLIEKELITVGGKDYGAGGEFYQLSAFGTEVSVGFPELLL